MALPGKVSNPVLRGFNPDPSIVRVGEDYYIATSTFEWFPGIRIHYSRDLVRWRLLGHCLTGPEQLDRRDDGPYNENPASRIEVGKWERFYLRADLEGVDLRFFASPDGRDWQSVGSPLDMGKLADDYGSQLNFTGAFVGLAAYDLNGGQRAADFDYFKLEANPPQKGEAQGKNLPILQKT